MQTVFILFLFILQLISFYFIALLYMKVSKFNNLEKKQQQLMAEMDDAIGAYLSELKEENERLIRIIEKRQENVKSDSLTNYTVAAERQKAEKNPQVINSPSFPMKVAMKSYQSAPSLNNGRLDEHVTKEVKTDDRTRAINMFDEGKPIEEIARRLGKGKTEVELLLKFR
jgi:hypothetical protein